MYLPVEIPEGVSRIDVGYSYDTPSVPPGAAGNSCDIGIFDQRGIELGGAGFRGWSGGSRTSFTISASDATPGYLPGPIRPGTWHVVLGPYQVARQGMDYRVQVSLTRGPDGPGYQPRYPSQGPATGTPGWYRGDCHLHTVYSDGRRTPEEVGAGARQAGLDFIATTDHNTSASHAAWGPVAGDDLLIITGEEVTTRNGHYLALGLTPGDWIDWRYRSRGEHLGRFATDIHRSGGIVVPAHPYCPYVGCRWKFGYDEADAVEVWNGPWTYDDEAAVETWDATLVAHAGGRSGWLPAMGSSDAHREPQVIGLPQTVVFADGCSRDALLAGLAAGRSWIAESRSVDLSLAAAGGGRSARIGERLAVRDDQQVTVTATVAGVPDGLVRIITDEGQMAQEVLPSSGTGTVTWTGTPQLAAYVRCEVRHPRADGSSGSGTSITTDLPLGAMAALTNPIWLGTEPGPRRPPPKR